MAPILEKIVERDKVREIVKGLKNDKKKIVLTNGCFDNLHVDHIYFLEKAKELGDILIVALNDDRRVKELKGNKRPIFPASERAYALSMLSCVDMIFIFTDSTGCNLLKEILPDVYVKGRDYEIAGIDIPEFSEAARLNIDHRFVGRFRSKNSTHILERLQQTGRDTYYLENWKMEFERLGRIKEQEQHWLIFAFLTTGAVISIFFSFAKFGTELLNVPIWHRFFIYWGTIIVFQLFAYIWIRKSLSLRKEYYSCRGNCIRFSFYLGMPIPDDWKITNINVSKKHEKDMYIKKWRDSATSPEGGKRWEMNSLVFLLILLTCTAWIHNNPTFYKMQSTTLESTPHNGPSEIIWGISLVIGLLLTAWPTLAYKYLDVKELKKIWKSEIQEIIRLQD